MVFQRAIQTAYAVRFARSLRVLTLTAPFREQKPQLKRLYQEALRQRLEYAFAMKWPIYNPEYDIDSYDASHHTRYVLAVAPGRRLNVEASMRLTRVLRLEKSLSFLMWEHAYERESFEHQLAQHKKDLLALREAGKHGNLWDLTRLMTASALLRRKNWRVKTRAYISIMLMLGGGLSQTGKDARWIFTCNSSMIRFMDKMGLEYHLLARGKISEADHSESFLCYSHVNDALEKLYRQKPLFFRLVNWGHYRGLTKD